MIRLLILVLLAWGSTASAQALRVRSGEHDGYTRVVVQVPVGTNWTLSQSPNGAQLSVAIDDVTFDTRSVFDRLSGNRLKALTQAKLGGSLDMAFGCDCMATAFLHRQSMVVIDIAPKANAHSVAALPIPPLSPQTPNPLPDAIPATQLALPLLQLDQSGVENRLMSRILQGADRDVVDLELAKVGDRPSTGLGPLRANAEFTANLQLRSILDEVRGLEALELPQLEPRAECITDSELGFASWPGEKPFSTQVAALRAGLFQEFDRVDEARALRLARLYTYHGFGVEALQVLDLMAETSPGAERISAIAHAMDGFAAPRSNPFAGQQRCYGMSALWALISEGELAADAHLDVIEQSFGRLPRHLRTHLGAALADILVDAGELEASRRILRSVERVLDQGSADVTLAKAEIAAAAGKTEKAEALLSEVASAPTTTSEAPIALARLIEKRWSDRGAVSPADLDLAASYARELRRSDMGPMMARTHTLALALSQDFENALGHIEDAPESSEWQRTEDQVLQLLAESADDITFLRHVIGLPDQRRDAISVETAVSLALRLTDLGFSTQALALASRPQDKTHRFDRAQLRARVALLQNRPNQALLEISEDESQEADQLRAQAISQTDDYAEAARLLREIGLSEAADRSAWLAGDAIVDAASQTVFGEIHQITDQLAQSANRQLDKPLADATALLEDSESARGRITDLLDRVQVQAQN